MLPYHSHHSLITLLSSLLLKSPSASSSVSDPASAASDMSACVSTRLPFTCVHNCLGMIKGVERVNYAEETACPHTASHTLVTYTPCAACGIGIQYAMVPRCRLHCSKTQQLPWETQQLLWEAQHHTLHRCPCSISSFTSTCDMPPHAGGTLRCRETSRRINSGVWECVGMAWQV